MADQLTEREAMLLGWAWGEACNLLDKGQDPRNVFIGDLITRAFEQLSELPTGPVDRDRLK